MSHLDSLWSQYVLRRSTSVLTLNGEASLLRGLRYLERVSTKPAVFVRHGHDLLFCFYSFALTSPRSEFQRRAAQRALRLGRRWRGEHRVVSSRARPDALHDAMVGHGVASRLGLPDERYRQALAAAARRFTPRDIYLFDPLREPPPKWAAQCERCGRAASRRASRCRFCPGELVYHDVHATWLDALLFSYFGEFAGVEFGVTFREVLRWLPHYRRVLRRSLGNLDGFPDNLLAITHLIYTLNDYGVSRLPNERFAIERRFLDAALPRACAERDLEAIAEIVEALAMLREPLDARLVEAKTLLARSQNSDGSWGAPRASAYTRYHTTWTCLDALRPRRFLR